MCGWLMGQFRELMWETRSKSLPHPLTHNPTRVCVSKSPSLCFHLSFASNLAFYFHSLKSSRCFTFLMPFFSVIWGHNSLSPFSLYSILFLFFFFLLCGFLYFLRNFWMFQLKGLHYALIMCSPATVSCCSYKPYTKIPYF